jgi:hypothetical protein
MQAPDPPIQARIDGGDIAGAVADVMAQAFDGGRWCPAAIAHRAAGPRTLRLQLGDCAARIDYGRSLQPALAAANPVDIAVLTADDADLRCLVPLPSDQGRARITAAYAAIWHADASPLLYLFDRQRGRGVVWLAAGAAPPWELGRPACPLVHAALLDTPWTSVHSAAVGRSGQVLMLAGAGNSGKSTAALACARAGWDYAGDDYVLAEVERGEVAPLYASARLRPAMGPAFAEWVLRGGRGVSPAPDPRHELTPDPRHGLALDPRHELALDQILRPGQLRGGPVRALLLLRRRGSDRPTFEPATRGEAFHALFLNSNYGAPGPLSVTAGKLATLVGRMPVFQVDTGNAPQAIPEAFERFMARL